MLYRYLILLTSYITHANVFAVRLPMDTKKRADEIEDDV